MTKYNIKLQRCIQVWIEQGKSTVSIMYEFHSTVPVNKITDLEYFCNKGVNVLDESEF
mgnify:CR=1 FL=1